MQGWGWRTHRTHERDFGMRATQLPSSPVTAASPRVAWLAHYAASRPQVSLRRLLDALQADFGMQRTCRSLLSAEVGDLGPSGILPVSRAKARSTSRGPG